MKGLVSLGSSIPLIWKSILISSLLCLIATLVAYYELGVSEAYGIVLGFGLAISNFIGAAYLIKRCMNRETNPLASVVLPGFLMRLPLILGIIYYLAKISWTGIYTLVGSFIGAYSCLLFVELKIVNNLAKLHELKIRKE